MKKLLFTMFYATVVISGLGLFLGSSDTYANQPQCNTDITTDSVGNLQGNTCLVGNVSNLTSLVPGGYNWQCNNAGATNTCGNYIIYDQISTVQQVCDGGDYNGGGTDGGGGTQGGCRYDDSTLTNYICPRITNNGGLSYAGWATGDYLNSVRSQLNTQYEYYGCIEITSPLQEVNGIYTYNIYDLDMEHSDDYPLGQLPQSREILNGGEVRVYNYIPDTTTNTCNQGAACTSDSQCGSGTCGSSAGSYAMPGGVNINDWNSSHPSWNTMCGYEVEVDITTPNPSGPVPAHISCAVMGQNPDPGPGKKYIVQTGYCRDTDPSLVQCGWVTTPQVCQCNTNPLDLPGTCGNAHGQTLAAAPTMPAQLCGKGNTPSPVTGVGPWSWQCTGTDNSVAQCSANIAASPTNGVCGTANNGSYSSAPTNNLCQSGTSSTVSGNGPWSWSCNGSNGGGNASCNANIAPVHAMCGTANGIPTSATPSGASLCQIGLPLPVSGPSGNPASFTWSCMGLYGGNNVPCSAPYQGTACVQYDPTGIHAGLDVSITPNDTIKAVFLNHPEDKIEEGIVYTTSGSYSFTGPISATQDLKVTITNLATFAEPTSRAQFIQFREINSNSTAGKFYGNLAGWNVINPLALLHNQANANNGMQVDAGDLNRGWIYPNNPASQFVAWNKATRGFNVTMQVCSTSNPYPITRNASCDAIPAHTIYNTTSTIVQTQASSGAAWLPSTTSVYNTTASTTECRFVCESGYNWNGSACVQNVTYSWDIGTWSGVCPDTQQTRPVVCKDNNGNTVADNLCPQPKPATTQPLNCTPTNTCEDHYGEACTGTGDTLGYGGSCIGHTQATLGTCNTNTSVSCTAASQCPDRVTPTWFPTAYTPATGSIGLSGDEVKIFNSNGGYIGICSKKVFDFYSGKVPYSVLNAEGMGSWDGDGWYNPRSAVYAIGEPSYYLFNNQNLGTTLPGNTYYYTKLCRNINGAAISATSNSWDAIYFIGPVTSNDWYRHDVVYRYNAHVYSWGNNNWAGFQSRVLKPGDHPSQPATVTKQCNGYIPEKAGNYYCATSGVQCAPSNAVASYFSNSNYPFSQSLKDGFTSFTSYRDAYYHGFGVSNSALQLCRGLTGSGDLIRASYPGTNGRGVGMSSLGSAGVLNVWNCSNGTQTLSCPGYVMSGSTNW